MENIRRKGMTHWIISALCLFGALCLTGTAAVAQSGVAKDSCDAVHSAYRKSFQANSQMSTKNSGTVDVTKAQAEITGDGSYTESCKLLREETLSGETASVYSDVMKSRLGIADGKLWISKNKGLVLQQEVEADMGAKGKGKQTIVFDYEKK